MTTLPVKTFNFHLFFTVLLHMLCACCSRYEFSVLNNLEPFIENFTVQSIYSHYGHVLTSGQWAWAWSLINSVLLIGSLIGCLLIRPTTDNLGRRLSVMALKNVVFIVSLLLQFAARPLDSVELLFVGRFVFGLAHPLSLFTPTFVSECAPVHIKGRASFATGIGLRLWVVLAPILGIPYLLGTEERWHWALLIPIFPSLIHLIGTVCVHESPKFLYLKRKDVKASSRAIKWYHGKHVDVNEVFVEYNKEADLAASTNVSASMIFKTKHLRWPFILCLASAFTVPASGIIIVHSYSTPILLRMGVPQEDATLYSSLLLQLPCVAMSFFSTALVERFGRRPLLLFGFAASLLGLCQMFVADFFVNVSQSLATILSLSGMMFVGNGVAIGPGLVYLIFPGELCPTHIRSYTSGVTLLVYWFLLLVVGFGFPVLANFIGNAAVLPQIVLGVLLWFFLWRYVPETKGKTVEEVSRIWRTE